MSNLLSRHLMIIVAAPSGAGKSTFLARALKALPMLEDTTTYTTRAMRSGESEGHPYHFVTREKFEKLIGENFFVEWARVHDQLYGTPEHQIHDIWARGHVAIMDVDVQGAHTFKSKFPKEAVSIFIQPPSLEELKRRIVKRDGQETADLAIRMESARKELARANEFDYQVVNDDFESSYARFQKLVEDLIASS